MAKNVLFLVHGMGWNRPAGAAATGLAAEPWFAEVEAALRSGWQRFPSLATRSFDRYIELAPLHYDTVFSEYLAGVSDRGAYLQQKLGGAGYAKLFGAITGAEAGEQDFFWASIMDVVLYRLAGDLYRNVHVTLGKQIAERVRTDWASGTASASTRQYSMLSHSLGTAAVHGALNRLGGGRIAGTDVLKLGGNFKLHVYCTLANVSRVLWRGSGSIYDKTIVKPQIRGPQYVRKFINVRHAADPIPAPMRFQPTDWGAGYSELCVRHARHANLHGYAHYLAHPRVIAALLEPLLPPDMLEPGEVDAVVAGFRDVDHDDPAKRLKVEQLITEIAQSLEHAYGDEANLISDSVELLAQLTRKLWRCRQQLQAALGVLA